MLARPEWNDDRREYRKYPPEDDVGISARAWFFGILISVLIWTGLFFLFDEPISHMLALGGL